VERAHRRVRRVAHWLDEAFRIPGTRFRVGLQPIIGMVPVVGDLLGLALSGFPIQQAIVLGAPRLVVVRMIGVVLLNFLIGLLPGAGDIADAVFKANTRNLRLLETYLASLSSPPQAAPPHRRAGSWLVWVLTVMLGITLLAWLLSLWLT